MKDYLWFSMLGFRVIEWVHLTPPCSFLIQEKDLCLPPLSERGGEGEFQRMLN